MIDKTSKPHPFVSVIIPVYNDPIRIQSAIKAVLHQTYPKDRYEIIVVDNGSTDHTLRSIILFPVIVLQENKIKSSYAARNKGLKFAKGDIIAFTDSDTDPKTDWLEQGVFLLDKSGASLVGGRVKFVFSEKKTASEYFDTINNIQMEENIKTRGVANTANLFIKRAVFTKIGNFPSDVRSGGDIYFTAKASSEGFTIVYSHSAVVEHPTRPFMPLFKKALRTGIGKCAQIKKAPLGKSLGFSFRGPRLLAHLNPVYLHSRLVKSGYHLNFRQFISILLVSYIFLAGNIAGVLWGLVMPQPNRHKFW